MAGDQGLNTERGARWSVTAPRVLSYGTGSPLFSLERVRTMYEGKELEDRRQRADTPLRYLPPHRHTIEDCRRNVAAAEPAVPRFVGGTMSGHWEPAAAEPPDTFTWDGHTFQRHEDDEDRCWCNRAAQPPMTAAERNNLIEKLAEDGSL